MNSVYLIMDDPARAKQWIPPLWLSAQRLYVTPAHGLKRGPFMDVLYDVPPRPVQCQISSNHTSPYSFFEDHILT